MRNPQTFLQALLIGGLAIAPWACSGDDDGDKNEINGSGGSGGNVEGGAAAGGTGAGTIGVGGMSGAGNTAGTDGGLKPCAAQTTAAKLPTLDLFVMMDQSGSMVEGADAGTTPWQSITDAVTTFLNAPEASGIGVGIGYFPLLPACQNDMGCSLGPCLQNKCVFETMCMAADYSTPAVGIGPVAMTGTQVITSMQAQKPLGGTPIAPALDGALQYAKTWQTANPDHRTVVVLATDGLPEECAPSNTISTIAGIAKAGKDGTPSIPTFVIGVGQLEALNPIAEAGGSSKAIIVDANANVTQQFKEALEKVQDAALPCEYDIPPPQSGEPDFEKVNLIYTPSGGTPSYVLYVEEEAKCDPTTGGWYYDNKADPKKILVCPTTCSLLQSNVGASAVDIELGCQTVIPR